MAKKNGNALVSYVCNHCGFTGKVLFEMDRFPHYCYNTMTDKSANIKKMLDLPCNSINSDKNGCHMKDGHKDMPCIERCSDKYFECRHIFVIPKMYHDIMAKQTKKLNHKP